MIQVRQATSSQKSLPEIKSIISQTLCGLSHPMVIPDTALKASNFQELLPSMHSSAEAKEHSPSPGASLSLSVSESVWFFVFLLV